MLAPLPPLPLTTPSPFFLAQAAVPPLPSPPFFSRYLFEEPLLPAIVLLIASVIVFFIFNSKGAVKRAIGFSSLGAVLAMGVFLLAEFIQTDREKIIDATTPLVSATAAADTARLSPMLHEQVRLTNDLNLAADELPHGEDWDKARLLNQVSSYLGQRWRIKEAAILEVHGVIDRPGRGRTQVRIRTTPELMEIPLTSWWRIDWQEDPDGRWRVIGIQPLDLGLPWSRGR